ncbi:MAG: HAD hydrolase-like protein [Saprospiraceae bacterium]
MEKEKIRLCVFDIAGTVLRDNNDVQKIFIKSFKAFGLTADPRAVNQVMGYEKKYAIKTLLQGMNSKIKLKSMTETIYSVFNQSMIDFYLNHSKPTAYAEVSLKKIKSQDIKIALNTGFGKEIMNTILTALHWEDLVDARISSDQVVAGRPHPFMIEMLKKRTGIINGAQVAKIGDTPSDLMEGKQAECALNIGIYSKNFPLKIMKQYEHTHLVANIREATSIVLDYNATI